MVGLSLAELLGSVSAMVAVAVVKSAGLFWMKMIELRSSGRADIRMLPCSSKSASSQVAVEGERLQECRMHPTYI
jgi:hypothetical protein